MKREKIIELAAVVRETLETAKKSAEKTKNDADAIAKVAANSPSQSGDRFHSRAQAEITAGSVSNLKYLSEELEKACEKEIPETIKPVCIATITSTASSGDFVLVNNPVYLRSSLKLISPHSPLGKALIGKSKGQKFSYTTDLGEVKGEVVDIG
jgi:hypothetical protein